MIQHRIMETMKASPHPPQKWRKRRRRPLPSPHHALPPSLPP